MKTDLIRARRRGWLAVPGRRQLWWVLGSVVLGLLAATLRHGLLRLGGGGAARPVGGLPDSWVLHLAPAADRDGVRVGTQDGAAHVDGQGRVQRLRGLPHPCVHNFLDLGHTLWVATEGGTLRYRTGAGGPEQRLAGR